MQRLIIHPILAEIMRACGMWRDRDHVESKSIPKLWLVGDECRCRVCLEDEPIVRTTTENAIFVADRPIKGA